MNDGLVVSEADIQRTCGDLDIPPLGLIEQVWDVDPIPQADISAQAAAAVDSLDFTGVPEHGEVAIGAGSRGIANLAAIVRGVVEGVSDLG